MDKRAFDGLARHIARRGVLQGVLAVAGATLLGQDAARALVFCEKKSTGGKCRNGGDCCSHRCKKKGKHKGKCLCSKLRKDCASADDCCSSTAVCSTQSLSPETVCCQPLSGPCQTLEDCCGNNNCSMASHVCIPPV